MSDEIQAGRWRHPAMRLGRALARWAVLAPVLGAALGAHSPAARAATLQAQSLARPEGERHYLLAQPAQPPAGLMPLVILLHGNGGSAAQLLGQQDRPAPMAGWLGVADREGLLVAAPDGTPGADHRAGWHDCRADALSSTQVDDVGLVAALIDREVATHHADPRRVYVMGMSNGGLMAFRLAGELGARLAAFAAVSSSMPAQSACPAPSAPLSVLLIAGTADPVLPYAGGPVKFKQGSRRGTVAGADAAAAFWRQLDGLPAAPARSEALPHLDAQDGTRATRIVWGADPAGLQVELLRIDGGGHVEPSIAHRYGQGYLGLVGPQSGDLEVAEEGWAFFKDKRLPARAP